MRIKMIAALLLIVSSIAAYADDKPLIPMATVYKHFQSDDTTIRKGDRVFVFGSRDGKYVLQKNTVHVKGFYDPSLDNNVSQASGKNITLVRQDDKFKPILILKSRIFNAGEVASGSIDSNCFKSESLDACKIHFKTNYTVIIKNKSEVDSDASEKFYNYELIISDGQFSSEITGESGDVNSLVWVGDLDRDGKLDIITDGTAHYNTIIGFKLYLSSYAKKGQLFGFAGRIFAYG